MSTNAAESCAVIIFGASGDLAGRKLIPSLYHLFARRGAGPAADPPFAIIGFARTAMTDDAFRALARAAVERSDVGPIDEEIWGRFAKSLAYVSGEYHQPEAFEQLSKRIDEIDEQQGLHGNRLFYLATPPTVYPLVIEQLDKAHLAKPTHEQSWVRIIIEKPYGRDLASARQLNQVVLKAFDESQVYRIDHYLGKETVQNLLVLRFANGIFEPLWNRNYVDHVQVTVAESIGIEHRGEFYESTGALRDVLQNHVMQLVALVAMEAPAVFDATSVRNEKLKVVQSIHPFSTSAARDEVVRGQYGPGTVGSEQAVGYRQEQDVKADSSTETYVAARLLIDNWRWAGVPFYVRTGKRLTKRVTEIAIQFRRAPHVMFRGRNIAANLLVLNIQPDEGISLVVDAKLPGQEMAIRPVTMDFRYRTTFGPAPEDAYATLINDCMRGDATLFDRADSVEAAWALFEPVLDVWAGAQPDFPNYAAGSWGPSEADDLLRIDGRAWRTP